MLAFPSWFSHFLLHRKETKKKPLSWGLPQAFKKKVGWGALCWSGSKTQVGRLEGCICVVDRNYPHELAQDLKLSYRMSIMTKAAGMSVSPKTANSILKADVASGAQGE